MCVCVNYGHDCCYCYADIIVVSVITVMSVIIAIVILIVSAVRRVIMVNMVMETRPGFLSLLLAALRLSVRYGPPTRTAIGKMSVHKATRIEGATFARRVRRARQDGCA